LCELHFIGTQHLAGSVFGCKGKSQGCGYSDMLTPCFQHLCCAQLSQILGPSCNLFHYRGAMLKNGDVKPVASDHERLYHGVEGI